jgi:hypothetical protein
MITCGSISMFSKSTLDDDLPDLIAAIDLAIGQ